jgi:hypothetical protein
VEVLRLMPPLLLFLLFLNWIALRLRTDLELRDQDVHAELEVLGVAVVFKHQVHELKQLLLLLTAEMLD